MSEPHDMKRPTPPYLVSPQEEAVVDGAAVTFTWEPVAGATGYRLEVASDTAFETVVHEETVAVESEAAEREEEAESEETVEPISRTVAGVFPTDGTTYYWRVFSQNQAGESQGENIESFISGTPEDVAQHIGRPDHEERLGPLTELITGGSEDMLHLRRREGQPAPVTPPEAEAATPEAFYAAEDQMAVQHEGIEAGQIVAFVFLLIIAIGLFVWGAMQWFESVADQAHQEAAASSTYPELRQVELAATQLLNQYEVINADQGVYRIPIDRAIDLIIDESPPAPAANYSQELQLLPGN